MNPNMLPSHASTGSAFAVLLIIVVLVIVLSGRSRKLGSGMSVLVLRRFAVSDDPQQETLVWITGRKSGLMGWILTVLGLSAETTLRVTRKEMLFRDTSLSGSSDSLLSLKGGIASVHCENRKPIAYLFVAVCFALSGIVVAFTATFAGAIGSLLLSGVMFVLYHFNKSVSIRVQSKGGAVFGMRFKPSLIENVSVDQERVRRTIELINARIVVIQSE